MSKNSSTPPGNTGRVSGKRGAVAEETRKGLCPLCSAGVAAPGAA